MAKENREVPASRGGTRRKRHLNFIVEPEAYHEFRELGARKSLRMRQLFLACFDAYKSAYGSAQQVNSHDTQGNKVAKIPPEGQLGSRLGEKPPRVARAWRQLLRGCRRLAIGAAVRLRSAGKS